MLSFIFVQACFSKWWDLDVSKFDEKLANSNKEPIYMFVFSATCPHCRGIPESFRQFGREMESSKIVMTSLNCSHDKQTCIKVGVRGFPTWFYINDPNPSKWEFVGYRDPRDWKKFIDSKSDGKTPDNTEIQNKVEKGKAVFHIVGPAQPENLASLKEDLKRSDSEIIFEAKSNSEMTVYLGPKCHIKATKESIDTFVQEHRFGHLHKYTFDDWNFVTSTSTLAVFFVQNKMTKEEKDILIELSHEFCGKMSVGWAPIGHSFKIMKKLIKGDQSKAFIGASNGNCNSVLRSDNITLDAARSFLQSVYSGKAQCVKIEENKAEQHTAHEQMQHTSFINGIWWISGVAFVVLVSCIAVIVTRKMTEAQKKE